MSDEGRQDGPSVQAQGDGIAVGSISIGGDVSGAISIGHTIGYTAEQVSLLIKQITTTFQPKPFDGRCPYKGLDVFEEEDAELFFGREKLVEDLVARVRDSRTLFITGPSGSGKSSLVRAGLLHALRGGALEPLHSERWLYESMKPGRDPLGELARVVSGLAGSTSAGDEIREKGRTDAAIFARWCEIVLKDGRHRRLVLFIDQFEEVFTQVNREEERAAFLDLLTHAATVENGRVILLFAMRSDFLSNCATYPELNALLNREFVQIGAMGPDELVSAIAQPALRVGLRIDPDLVAQIINDMQGEPGALPLMQFALKDLFDAQQDEGSLIALTREAYIQRGGIHKSLERHADKTFAGFNAGEQELARSIFSGLIEIGRGTQDTRRTALFDELVPADVDTGEIETIVRKLADARLITTDEQSGRDTVTISHEKLIEAWPWLKKLVNENRDVIALQNEIAADAIEWEGRKRDASYLYSGARLVNANEQLKSNRLVLSGTALEYIRAGQARQRRGRFALIGTTVTVIALLVLAVSVFSYQSSVNAQLAQRNEEIAVTAQFNEAEALANAEEAQKQAEIALARQLAALSQVDFDSLSLLLSIEAYTLNDDYQTKGALLNNILNSSNKNQFLSAIPVGAAGSDDASFESLAFSPDGRFLASSGCRTPYGPFCVEFKIVVWDMQTRQPAGQPIYVPYMGEAVGVLSSVEIVFDHSGDAILLNMEDVLYELDLDASSYNSYPVPNSYSILKASPDLTNQLLLTWENAVVFWNALTEQETGKLSRELSGQVKKVVLDPDGRTLMTGSCMIVEFAGEDENCIQSEIILWDLVDKEMKGGPYLHEGEIKSISPDQKVVAVVDQDKTIVFIDLSTDQRIGSFVPEPEKAVRDILLSPDSKSAAILLEDGSLLLWDIHTAEPIGRHIQANAYTLLEIAFSPDGKLLASGGGNDIVLWESDGKLPLKHLLTGKKDTSFDVTIAPNGRLFSLEGAQVIQWDPDTGQSIGAPIEIPGENALLDTSGKFAASVLENGDTAVFDLVGGDSIQQLPTELNSDSLIVFSPDGRSMVSVNCLRELCFGDSSRVFLWDVNSGDRIEVPPVNEGWDVTSLSFSPDGSLLALGFCYERVGIHCSSDNRIALWDIDKREYTEELSLGDLSDVTGMIFDHEGRLLAFIVSNSYINTWDFVHGGSRDPGTPMFGVSHRIAFSADDSLLASADFAGNIFLWDVTSRQRIGQLLETDTTFDIDSMVFSQDGKKLVLGGCDLSPDWDCVQGNILLLDVDPASWVEKACAIAGRNFTSREWLQYMPPAEVYRKTCPQWPLESEAISAP